MSELHARSDLGVGQGRAERLGDPTSPAGVDGVAVAVVGSDALKQQLDRFTEMVDELMALQPFIERPGLIVVPDTSAFVEGVYFTDLTWQELADIDPRMPVRLVVPVLVVDELDELKRGRDRARERARSVLRRLWELNSNGKKTATIPGSRPVTVEVLADDSWHVRRPVNDNEIIERALYVGEITGKDVILAAADYSMLFQASSAGLKTALVDRPGEDTAP